MPIPHSRIVTLLIKPAIYLFLVLGVGASIVALAEGAEARVAYGALSAWWAGLYGAYLISASVRTAICVTIGWMMLAILSALSGWNVLYHDIPDAVEVEWLGLTLVQALIIASPILINALAQKCRNQWFPEWLKN